MHQATSASQAAKCKVLLSRYLNFRDHYASFADQAQGGGRSCIVAVWFVPAFQTPIGPCKLSYAAVFNLHRS